MDDEIKWPKKGDKLFKQSREPFSSTYCSLEWLQFFNVDDSLYAKAYKDAADKLIDDLKKGEGVNNPDMLFIPIAYLYRHCIELKMKHLIMLGNKLELLTDVPQKKLTRVLSKEHGLHTLWNLTRKIMNKGWPEASQKEKEELNATEKMILEFHNIDKSGQNLRYAKDTRGEETAKHLPTSVQLSHMREAFEAIYNMLDGCDTGLKEWLDAHYDMLNDISY